MNNNIAEKLARLAAPEKDFPECYIDYKKITIEGIVCIDNIRNEYEILFECKYGLTTKMYEFQVENTEKYILQCIENDANATLFDVQDENRSNPRKIILNLEK